MVKKIKEIYRSFSEDNCTMLAASLAYFAVFSFPGIIILIISTTTALYNSPELETQIRSNLGILFGADGKEQISSIIKSADNSEKGIYASLFGVVLVMIGATGFIVQLQQALDTCLDITGSTESLKKTILKRLISLSMILTISFLLLISFSLNAFLYSASERYISRVIGENIEPFLLLLNYFTSVCFQFLLFSCIYTILPSKRLSWRAICKGALVTTILFTLGKSALEYYISNYNIGSTYGTASSVIILITWAYYSTLILLLGAHIVKLIEQKKF